MGHFEALGALAAVATFAVVSRLLPRHPAPRKYWITGFLALTAFGVLLARLDPAANPWLHILPALACYNIFLLTVLPITAMQTFREMENDETLFSNAQQVKNMLAQAGIALGIAVATLGQQWRTTVHYSVLNAQVTPDNPVFLATIRQLQDALTTSVGPVAGRADRRGRGGPDAGAAVGAAGQHRSLQRDCRARRCWGSR